MKKSLFNKIVEASSLLSTAGSCRHSIRIPPLFPFFLRPQFKEGLLSLHRSLQPYSLICTSAASLTFSKSSKSQLSTSTCTTMVQSPVKINSPSKRHLSSPSKQNSPLKRLQFNDQDLSPSKRSRGEDNNAVLYFVKMTDKAHQPTKGSKLAAGYDLKSAYECVVPARGSCLVKTDIQIKLPSGTYGRIAPRSGLALKNKIDVGAGVIDEDYRGPVGVILFNHGDVEFKVNEGDRIAQLICQKIAYPEIVEVKDLDDTERGEGGFGSTGVGSDDKAKMDTTV